MFRINSLPVRGTLTNPLRQVNRLPESGWPRLISCSGGGLRLIQVTNSWIAHSEIVSPVCTFLAAIGCQTNLYTVLENSPLAHIDV